MNILIVDGNEKEPSDKYVQLGMDTQYNVYSNDNKVSIVHFHVFYVIL